MEGQQSEAFAECDHRLPAIEVAANGPRQNPLLDRGLSIDDNTSAQWKEFGVPSHGDAERAQRLTSVIHVLALQCAPELEPLDTSGIISACKSAIETSPDEDGWLSLLGLIYHVQYSQTRNLRDLDRAIPAGLRGVKLTPRGYPGTRDRQRLVLEMLNARFEVTNCPHDLQNAIDARQKALKPSSVNVANHAKLFHLLAWLRTHLESPPYLSGVEEALSITQRAIQILPDGHLALPILFNSLGTWFLDRCSREGEEGDKASADAAVLYFNTAVELALADSVDLPLYSSNLDVALLIQGRFSNWDGMDSISRAAPDSPSLSYPRARDKTPESAKDTLPRPFQYVANLCARFRRHRNPSVLAEGVSQVHNALNLTPGGHPELATILRMTILAIASQFSITRDPTYLPQAIAASRELLQITAGGSLNLAEIHIGLGVFHEHLASTAERPLLEIDQAILHFKAGALCSSESPKERRLEASLSWAELTNYYYPRSPDILQAFDVTLNLIDWVDGRDQIVRGNYAHLQELSKVPCRAAAAACGMGKPEKAVEWLERGRCLVWSCLRHLKALLTPASAHNTLYIPPHNDIVHRQGTGSKASQLVFAGFLSKLALMEIDSSAQLGVSKSWEDEIKMPKGILSFEGLLNPPIWSTVLQNLPTEGPVIIVNLASDRCDALALLAGLDQPLHIPLPSFSLDKAKQYRSELKVQLNIWGLRTRGEVESPGVENAERAGGLYRRKCSRGDNRVVRRILRCLWMELVKPILDMLGISKRDPISGGNLPRVWWCPTGPLSFLPIHAAGVYGSLGSESVLDYAVSSYTPSVTSLLDRVIHVPSTDQHTSGLFLTNQPRAPHQARILETTTEVRLIYDKATKNGIEVHKMEGSEITPKECLHYMESFSAVHLACHASQNLDIPMKSQFRFHTGSLDLVSIMKSELKHADLAFLSACQTSAGEESLSEEAIHLAAGMLAAGYRRVVSTMWGIQDRHAPGVADDFYEYLWSREDNITCRGGAFDGALSAHALHHATQELRGRLGDSESDLLTWVPYVHFGY